MTRDQRREYGMTGHWAKPAPEMATINLSRRGQDLPMPPSVGSGNRDVLYGALGVRQLPTIDIPGLYKNSLGEVEKNDASGARLLIDYPTGGGAGKVDPLTSQTVSAVERLRGLIDAQEASAANIVNTTASLPGKNAAVIDTGGQQLTPDQLQKVSDLISGASDNMFLWNSINAPVLIGVNGSNTWTFDTSQNLVPATAAKGINFTANTPAAGMTSQLLNNYEEGTWTPVATSSVGSITSYTSAGNYSRVGNTITIQARVTITNAGTATGALYVTLPFTAGPYEMAVGCGREDALTGNLFQVYAPASSTVAILFSSTNTTIIATSMAAKFSFTYKV